MARKDRVPNPPKRVQAPKRRSASTTPDDADRRRKLLLAGLAALLVVAAIVGGYLALGGGGNEDSAESVRAALVEAGCTLESQPAQPGDHTAEIDADDDPKWNTDPPTTGPHYQVPAIFGEYDSPVQVAQAIHNLEHGGVYIFCGEDVPEETVSQLSAFYDEDPTGLLLAPLPRLGETIALGAWVTPDPRPGAVAEGGNGYLAECTEFDENAFTTFRDEFRFKGPERFPEDQLNPGM
jgi:hypothetical protein